MELGLGAGRVKMAGKGPPERRNPKREIIRTAFRPAYYGYGRSKGSWPPKEGVLLQLRRKRSAKKSTPPAGRTQESPGSMQLYNIKVRNRSTVHMKKGMKLTSRIIRSLNIQRGDCHRPVGGGCNRSILRWVPQHLGKVRSKH